MVDPPYFSLNTDFINHMADVPNATAPRAWSADLYDLAYQEAQIATMTGGSQCYTFHRSRNRKARGGDLPLFFWGGA